MNNQTTKLQLLQQHTVLVAQLAAEVHSLSAQLPDATQIAITSKDGNNDWTTSTGRCNIDPRTYRTVNQQLINSYIHQLVQEFEQYSRWRIMHILPRRTYSVHQDGSPYRANHRLHIPVVTNPHSWLLFYTQPPTNGTLEVEHHHLEPGSVYNVDTTGLHTAVNWGTTTRTHIVAERTCPTAAKR